MNSNWQNIKTNHTPSTSSINLNFLKKIKKNSKVLEIGSGRGRIIDILNKKKCFIVGVDINNNELNNLKHKYSDNNKIKFLNFNIINGDFKKLNFESLDFVFMNGLLGALNKFERVKAINNICKIVNKNTLIHISEFLLFERSLEMKNRYNKDFLETNEYGSFFILDNNGNKIGITHNFSRKELINLLEKRYRIIKEFKQDFISYTNKIKPGIILIIKLK
jgi:ubiquinone/menaquinone biosynthesis C-methylase UbiE